MVFRDSLFAPTSNDPAESSPTIRRNISDSGSGKALLPVGASFPISPSEQGHWESSRSANSNSDVEAVDRIANAVAERLANRLGNDAFSPPPGYVDSEQWHAS